MMNNYYSGTDGYCLEEFLTEFKSVAELNEWRKSDYSLILGRFLHGAAYYYYRMIFKYDMDFAVLCDCLRSEFLKFHRRCRYCEQRIIKDEIKADKKQPDVLCEDVNAHLFSSIVIKDEQTQNIIQCSEKSVDHIDGEGDATDGDGDHIDGESCMFEHDVDQTSRNDSPVDVKLELKSVFQDERADGPTDDVLDLLSSSESADEGIVMCRSSPIDSNNSIDLTEHHVQIPSEQQVGVPSDCQSNVDVNILNPIDFEHNIVNNIEMIQSDIKQNFIKVILKRKKLTAIKKSFSQIKPKEIRKKFKGVYNKVFYCANKNSNKAVNKKVMSRIKYKIICNKTSWGARFGRENITMIVAKKNSIHVCLRCNLMLGYLHCDHIKHFNLVKCKFWKFYRKKIRDKYRVVNNLLLM